MAEMDWGKLGALFTIGCFVLAGLTLLFQIKPLPWKGVKDAAEVSVRPQPRWSKLMAVFIITGFLVSGLTLWSAWQPTYEGDMLPRTGVSWQKAIASPDPEFKFAIEAGIQTDKEYKGPAQLFIICDGDIGKVYADGLQGEGNGGGALHGLEASVMMPPSSSWFNPDIYNMKWQTPLWKPGNALVLRICSKKKIKVNYAIPVIFRSDPKP